MSDRETHGDMHTEIEVTDFGPIVRGKVTLRPLTVFVGPSNTGKSYLATLIYALHRHFTGHSGGVGRRRRQRIFARSDKEPLWLLSRDEISEFYDAARSAATGPAGSDIEIALPASMAQTVHREIEEDAKDMDAGIANCFGVEDVAMLIRRERKDCARILLRRDSHNGRPAVEHELVLQQEKTDYRMTGLDDMPISVGEGADVAQNALSLGIEPGEPSALLSQEELYVLLSGQIVDALYTSALPHIASPFHVPAYYLPADRGGTMHAHQVVVSALVQSATMAGIRPTASRTPMLSGVLADFLDELLSINRPSYRHPFRMRKKNRRDWGADIEESMLGGKIEMEPGEVTGYPHFFYRPAHWKRGRNLPLMNASSMISELAPVVLYLRHRIEIDDVLIVEEPEAHLHPAMQAEFMRQLIGCVRAGIRIIVTTHSEWLIEELANAVKRSEIPEKQRKILPNGNAALPPDKVGVHLFRPSKRPRGSIVNEVSPDERGLYRTGFDDVAMSTHNQWADIASLIGRGK